MDLLKENWGWIIVNPWGAVSIALLSFGLGWGAARLLLEERISLLKEKLGERKSEAKQRTACEYPPNGRHGRNVLSNSAQEILAGESLSLRADIPLQGRLRVDFTWIGSQLPAGAMGAWTYAFNAINWTASTYDSESGGKQTFQAEGGVADLRLQFVGGGQLQVDVYENDAPVASWSKKLRVRSENPRLDRPA